MAKIILLSYGGGHVNMLLPVVRLLQVQGHELIVFGLTTAGAVLVRSGIPFKGFKDLLPLSEDVDETIAVGKRLVGNASSNSAVSYEESVAYMGLSYLDMVLQHGQDKAATLYKAQGRRVFYPFELMTKLLTHERPDLVISTNSPRAEKALIDAAGSLKIPSLCLVDLFASQEAAWIGKLGYASRVCVLSDYVRNKLIALGRRPEDVVVTGNPSFDTLLPVKRRVSENVKRDGVEGLTILWASQPELEEHPFNGKKGDVHLPRKIENELIRLALSNSDWKLVFRPHPSESVSYTGLPSNVKVSVSSDSLYDLLATVDVVVTMSSTVGLEAVLVGLPLVTVDKSIFTQDAPYSEMGLSVGVKHLNDLEYAIEQAVSKKDSAGEKKLPSLGGAAERVVREINSLLGGLS